MLIPAPGILPIRHVVVAAEWAFVGTFLAMLTRRFADYAVARIIRPDWIAVIGWAASPRANWGALNTLMQYEVPHDHPVAVAARERRVVLVPQLSLTRQAQHSLSVPSYAAKMAMGAHSGMAAPILLRGQPGSIGLLRSDPAAAAFADADARHVVTLIAQLAEAPAATGKVLAFRPAAMRDASKQASKQARQGLCRAR